MSICPLCEEGNLYPKVKEKKLHYSVCDYCHSEQADNYQVRLNKGIQLASVLEQGLNYVSPNKNNSIDINVDTLQEIINTLKWFVNEHQNLIDHATMLEKIEEYSCKDVIEALEYWKSQKKPNADP